MLVNVLEKDQRDALQSAAVESGYESGPMDEKTVVESSEPSEYLTSTLKDVISDLDNTLSDEEEDASATHAIGFLSSDRKEALSQLSRSFSEAEESAPTPTFPYSSQESGAIGMTAVESPQKEVPQVNSPPLATPEGPKKAQSHTELPKERPVLKKFDESFLQNLSLLTERRSNQKLL